MTKKTKRKSKAEALAGSPSSDNQVPPVLPPGEILNEILEDTLSKPVGTGPATLPPGEYPLNIETPLHKVAILGTTPHRQDAPFDDPTFDEIWGVGPAMHDMISNSSGVVRRFTRWLEVHNPDMWVEGSSADDHSKNVYLPFLRSIGPKAMILRPHPVLPDATVIDVERIIKVFGASSVGMIKGSIEWCIAIALLEYHVDQPGQLQSIGAWGVDYATTAERREQKDGLRHWMDKARTFGVSFLLPAGSDMNATPRPYPLNDESPLAQKAIYRTRELQSRMNEKSSTAAQLRNDLRAVEDEIQQLSGALQDVQYWQQNDWM